LTALRILFPPGFTLLIAALFGMAYHRTWTPSDWATLAVAGCAALGWSTAVVFRHGGGGVVKWIYGATAILLPPVLFDVIGIPGFDPLWHRILWGLIVLGMAGVPLFMCLFMDGAPPESR